MECQICRRRAKPETELCPRHLFALKRLVRKYETWQKGAEVDWGEYLKRVDSNPLTGIWVKEVITWADATRKTENELRALANLPKPAPLDP